MARLIAALWLLLACVPSVAAPPRIDLDGRSPVPVRVHEAGGAARGDRLLFDGGAVRRLHASVEFTLPSAAQDKRWVLWLAHDPFDQVRVWAPGWAPAAVSFFTPDVVPGALPVGAGFVLPRGATGLQRIALELRGSVRSAPTLQVMSEQDVLRRAGREIGLAYAIYAALLTLLVASLSLYWAARDRLFLLYSGYSAASLLLMAAVSGHLYTLPGLRAVGTLGARGFWLVVLVFNAMLLWTLLRFAEHRASRIPAVRSLGVLVPVMGALALVALVPEPSVASRLQAVATAALAVGMMVGVWVMLDAARRGVPMAFATGCALLVLFLAGSAREAMHRGLLDDSLLTRHGFQFALVLVSVTLFVGLCSRIGAVRQRLDDEASARRDSEYRLRQARARSDFGQMLQERLRGLHQEEVAPQAFRMLVQHVRSMFPGTQAVVVGQGFLGHDLLLVQEEGATALVGQSALTARGVVRVQVQGGKPVQLRLDGAHVSEDPRMPLHALVPVHVPPPAWAALVLRDPGGEAFDPADLDACVEVARLTVMHADEAHASIQLRRSAEHDALTGTMNRRSLDKVLAREFVHAGRAPMPLTVLFIDIDWFKRVNDEHGHACGDHCLRSIAATLRAELRPNDALGRYGGEEFLVALPGRDAAAARIIAERLRQSVERSSIHWQGKSLALTISIGLAARRPADATVEEMLERADKALYAAKREGRNRVCVAPARFA